MKIAINAIRVTGKAGGGFDTFIVNFVNALGQLSKCFDLYTLYPEHFPQVPSANIKQIKIPFLHGAMPSLPQQPAKSREERADSKMAVRDSVPISLAKKIFDPDLFRMSWTQTVFRQQAKKYDLAVALTEYEGLPFFDRQIIFIHSLVPFLFPHFETKHRFYTYRLLPKILRSAIKIVAVSENLKAELCRIFQIPKDKVAVIYEGIDATLFSKAKEEMVTKTRKKLNLQKPYILVVGHSHPIKNLKSTIEAFQSISSKINLDLVVAGYMEQSFLNEMRKILGKENQRVHFLGHIPNEQLPALYSGANFMLFASLYEGFGLPPLEAMACGCPVISSNKGALPEILGKAAFFVEPEPRSISDGIIKLYENPMLRNELIQKGYEQAKIYSWEKAANQTLNLFRECLD